MCIWQVWFTHDDLTPAEGAGGFERRRTRLIAPHGDASHSPKSPHRETMKDARDWHRLWCFFFFARIFDLMLSSSVGDSIAHLLVQLQPQRPKWTCKHRGKQRLVSQGCREIHEARRVPIDRLPAFSRKLCANMSQLHQT